MSNKKILESECDELALVYLHSADVFNEVEKDLKQIQAKEGYQISTKERKESTN